MIWTELQFPFNLKAWNALGKANSYAIIFDVDDPKKGYVISVKTSAAACEVLASHFKTWTEARDRCEEIELAGP